MRPSAHSQVPSFVIYFSHKSTKICPISVLWFWVAETWSGNTSESSSNASPPRDKQESQISAKYVVMLALLAQTLKGFGPGLSRYLQHQGGFMSLLLVTTRNSIACVFIGTREFSCSCALSVLVFWQWNVRFQGSKLQWLRFCRRLWVLIAGRPQISHMGYHYLVQKKLDSNQVVRSYMTLNFSFLVCRHTCCLEGSLQQIFGRIFECVRRKTTCVCCISRSRFSETQFCVWR